VDHFALFDPDPATKIYGDPDPKPVFPQKKFSFIDGCKEYLLQKILE
jgi:hypothetical protein